MTGMQRRLLVNRNESTIEWLCAKPEFHGFEVVGRLGDRLYDLEPGDVVCGTLPLHIAAAVCGRGAEYWAIRFFKKRIGAGDIQAADLEGVASVTSFGVRQGRRIV